MSPAVLRQGPYRFYFVSHDLHEPPHVHIDRDAFSAKFWLKPNTVHLSILMYSIQLIGCEGFEPRGRTG
jgi:hypothetical protein